MKSFEYAAPKTVKEATALLGDSWGESEILAGGTDLVTSLKQHITAPKKVASRSRPSIQLPTSPRSSHFSHLCHTNSHLPSPPEFR